MSYRTGNMDEQKRRDVIIKLCEEFKQEDHSDDSDDSDDDDDSHHHHEHEHEI